MRRTLVGAGVLVLSAIVAGPAGAQEASHNHAPTPVEAATALAKARRNFSPEFQKIRNLAGRWEGTTFRAIEGESAAVVTYEVTAGGSAVIEKLFPGTTREMTTLYHDDSSGRLIAHHYCNAANQPMLRLKESAGERMFFVLAPESDIKADLEGHAHELTLLVGNDGSLTHDWLNHYLGNPSAKRNIKLTRK